MSATSMRVPERSLSSGDTSMFSPSQPIYTISQVSRESSPAFSTHSSMADLPISDAGDLFALAQSPPRSRASSRASSDYQRLDPHLLQQPRLVADLQQHFGMTPKRVYGKKPGPKNLFRDEPHVETPVDIATSLHYPGPITKTRSLQHGNSRRERRVSKTDEARAAASRQRGVETASPALSFTSSTTTSSSWPLLNSEDIPIENELSDITPVSKFFPEMPMYRAPEQVDEFYGVVAPVKVTDDSEIYIGQSQHPQSPHSYVTSPRTFSSSSLAAALDTSALGSKDQTHVYRGRQSSSSGSPQSRRMGYESDSSSTYDFHPPPAPPPSSVNSVANSPFFDSVSLPSSYSPPTHMSIRYATTTSTASPHMSVGAPATQNSSSLSGWAG